MPDRRAEVTWHGSLTEGHGHVESVTSGILTGQDLTWKARAGEGEGASPEDLVAAAHASCFSMALSSALSKAGNPPDELRTSATVTFRPGEGITKIALTVEGSVPGIDESGFREAAEGAKANCPVSKALAGVPEITLDARLAG
jgi:osmotically inducible protein OsmC